MPKLDGWIQRPDGQVPLAHVHGVSVTELGLVVGIQIAWSRRTWELPDTDRQIVQVGLPIEIAREIGQALLEAADLAESGTGAA